MSVVHLTELRLSAFKSFRGAKLPLGGTTVLTGRNSSGKSNALDGLDVLARLSTGEHLREALDGRRKGPVRGGSEGCAPHGSDHFRLGCRAEYEDSSIRYDVEVEVRPTLRIRSESLQGPGVTMGGRKKEETMLFETRETDRNEPGLRAEVHTGKRGRNGSMSFRDDRTILSQLSTSLPGKNQAERSVLRVAAAIRAALKTVFHCDPVPSLMREYVPERDAELKRSGENLSAALLNFRKRDETGFQKILDLVCHVADRGVQELSFVRSELGDVMLTLDERRAGGQAERTPAKEMSDGLLRFMSIALALLSSRSGLDVEDPMSEDELRGSVLVVIEELENGLHPSQARRVLDLVRTSGTTQDMDVLVTTHSPALLDAAEGVLNERIIVCHREGGSGRSLLTPVTELPGYAAALAEGSLGRAVAAGKLVDDVSEEVDDIEFKRLIGIA